jgi:hypothetical protein
VLVARAHLLGARAKEARAIASSRATEVLVEASNCAERLEARDDPSLPWAQSILPRADYLTQVFAD